MVQEWFEEHNNEFEVMTWPPNPPHLNPIEHLWDVVSPIHGGPTLQLTGLKGSAANILVPDTPEHLQLLVESMPQRVRAVLAAKGGPTILGR